MVSSSEQDLGGGHHVHETEEEHKAKVLKIWKTAGILALVTAIEFVFAFTMDAGVLRTSIFVGLTLVKAFYIVAEFMHLKYETKGLVWAVLLPTLFLVWLILALIYEGGSIFA